MQRDEMMTDNGSDTKCAKCNLNFTSAKTLKNHQLEKHSQNVVKCFKCGLKFINSERFRAHWNSKHVTAKIPAQSVASTSNDGDAAIVLDDESEDSEPSQGTAVAMKNHKNVKINSNRCPVCFKTFSTRQFATLHYQRVHMDWTTKCEICSKRLKKNLYFIHLKNHRSRGEITVERIHEIQKEHQTHNKNSSKCAEVKPKVPTKCPDCGEVFISDRVMKIHWSKIHFVRLQKIDDKRKEEENSVKETIAVPAECQECHRIFSSDGRMRIHYYQAHIKPRTAKKVAQKKEENPKESCATTYPSIKTVSDLRSKPPDIEFDSSTCPACKKVFSNNIAAKLHFKVVHLREMRRKCPYPLCFNTCSTLTNMRVHFKRAHPKAILPKEFGPSRNYIKKQKKDNDENKKEKDNELNTSTNIALDDDSVQKHQDDTQEQSEKPPEKRANTKQDNPLLKMFAKMRERNSQSPVVPANVSSDVVEIDEDQIEENPGCFTLDFDRCSVCTKDFTSNEAAMMHHNQKHPEEMQMCPECNMLVLNSRKMFYHFKRNHSTVTFPLFLKSTRAMGYSKELFIQYKSNECTICKLVFETKAEAQAHFKDEHEIKFEICSVCSKGFRNESILLRHWAQVHNGLKFVEFNGQTPMEVDEVEESSPKVFDLLPKDAASPDLCTDNCSITKNSPKKPKNMKIFPFITSNMCPVCKQYYARRKSVVIHYKAVHAKNGIACKMCAYLFLNVDHLKEHWMLVHADTPWMNPECEKQKINKKEMKKPNDQLNVEISPNLNAIVSLVNMKDNLDSWSPGIRMQLLRISNDIDKAKVDTVEDTQKATEDEVSDSAHDSTVATDEELELSQNEPLDLSVQHKRPSPDDNWPSPNLIKVETIQIKYESAADMVTSFDHASTTGRSKKSNLEECENIIVKDEISIEETTLNE